MKHKSLLLLAMLLTVSSAWAWKPIFVGHRGSYRGVANTVEAYRNGADHYHYQGLECDVRVTKDGKYVILHDETTGSLCDVDVAVATTNYDDLRALTLKQTRSGNEYTGQICSVEEYLDICVEKGCFPMIELKWATGINNNDMSNFPGLWKLVTDRNLQDKAIFLTSMQKSLEYIKANYPQATCQYLLSSDSDAKLQFCKNNKINPSFSAGALTQAIVQRYAEQGLKVAAWTVNTEANYNKYGEMGVFMMTCDYLMPSSMPELTVNDPDGNIITPPDAVALEGSVLWTRGELAGDLPTNYPSKAGATYKTGEMAAVVDGKFYVNDYGTKSLLIFDENCTEPVVLPYSATELGGGPVHGICTDDAQNLIFRWESGINDTPSKVRIFRYGTTTDPVDLEFNLDTKGASHFINASGDVFSEEGGYLYFLPNSQTTLSIVHIANGAVQEVIQHSNMSAKGSSASWIIPINGPEKYIYMVRNVGFFLYDGKDKGDYFTKATSTTSPNRNSSCGGAYMNIKNHDLLVHTSGTNYNGGFSVRDMTADQAPLLSFPALGSKGYDVNASTGTMMKAVKVADDVYHLYNYTMGNGYGVYEIKAKGSGVNNVVANKDTFTAFPNPVITTTALAASKPMGRVNVYSIDGRLAMSVDLGNATVGALDMSSLRSGHYVAVTEAGQSVRLIKK